jgi:Lrp/AsnC family transcriptional regulator for asnA, asnC and gidA
VESPKKCKFGGFYVIFLQFKHIHIHIRVAMAMGRIGEIDRSILAELRKNGRISYVELAKIVGASERTVRTHVRRMEEMGTIRGYTIREGGVGLTALVRIKVSPGAEIGTFAGEVTGWEGVEILYEVSGETDLIALVHVDDTMALRQLLDRMWMAAPSEIASTTTELVLEQY